MAIVGLGGGSAKARSRRNRAEYDEPRRRTQRLRFGATEKVREVCQVPLIASGGAGEMVHFRDAFIEANVDGALAASVFHKQIINIGELKEYLAKEGVEVRR